MKADGVSTHYTAALEHLLRVIGLAAHEAETMHGALQLTVDEICNQVDWPVGHALLPASEGQLLWTSTEIWHFDAERVPDNFVAATREAQFGALEGGLLGRILERREPLWIPDLEQESDFTRAQAALSDGLTSALVVPVSFDDEVWALLEFYAFTAIDPDDDLLSALSQIGLQLGVVLKQKQTEADLRSSEERFKALVMNARDLITLIDGSGRIKYQSPSVTPVLGYEQSSLLGRKLLDFLHGQGIESVRSAIDKLRRREVESVTLDLRLRTQDGDWRWLESTFTQHLDHPDVRGIVVNSRDVTERFRAEQQLQQVARELERSNEELERFAYVASHDLQEPLRMVASYVQLLESRYADQLDEDAREFMGFAVEGAERMSRLINDLLAYSRLRSRGKDPEPTDLNVPLQQALRNLEPAIDETGAQVEWDSMPWVQGDEGQLMQVFQNLISNAVKFQAEGNKPRIRSWVEPAGERWRITVQDNGIGIDPSVIDRLFVIFTRLHARDAYGGTGIGLAMTKKIIERHGGKIGVESEPGEGSTFWFTLPAADPSELPDAQQTDEMEMEQI